jgi:prefoldin alpha subunit
MVDSSELQRMARLVDMNRQRLEEIQLQIDRVEAVQLEHDDTRQALNALSNGSSGHIPLGAGVMVPIPKGVTTIVDLGSGIFGERTPKDAAELVTKRLNDLTELKSQFEADAAVLTKRIEELAMTFEHSAKEMSESKEELPEQTTSTTPTTPTIPTPPGPDPTTKRRRRGVGGELTLDD